ncbi:MAG TPA: extracellular solute-binding protein, partial [Candidatus Binatia bacterium]|nr:extracellular solute-binding protein [Candidatus Binatia bacterium]
MRRVGFWFLGLILCLFTTSALAKEVVIVTSFPKELFETYKKAFEAKHPGIKVVINSKQTNAGVTYLRETKAKPEADIFWVSAPDAFQTLESEGLLQKYSPPKEIMAKIPAKIGNFPVHDSDGNYFGFAISGYGLMWNKNYLQAHKLPAPKEWTDLTNPRYYNHLVISAPSRSGTTHLTIEVILQAYGWDKGWGLLLSAGGNMGTITERSFGVPEAVISGQYGIGVVIDFFGLSGIASGQPVDFVYPSLTSVVPASVAIVKGGPNPDNARAFVNYLLSEPGQLVLFAPEIARLPVIPDLYAKAPKDYPNPFKTKLGGVNFNDALSSGRRDVVNSLFDHIITFRHRELKDAWGSIYKAEDALAKSKGTNIAQGKNLVAEARKLASQVPINDKKAGDKEITAAFKSKSGLKAQLETEWENVARANYARAKEMADKATTS